MYILLQSYLDFVRQNGTLFELFDLFKRKDRKITKRKIDYLMFSVWGKNLEDRTLMKLWSHDQG